MLSEQGFNPLHFAFVPIVVRTEIVGDAGLQLLVTDEVGQATGTPLIVERHDDAVHAVLYLSRGRGIIGHHHGLAGHLRLAHRHRLALVS